MVANIASPQTNASAVQMISTRSTGSFHQIRCAGGVTAIFSLVQFQLVCYAPSSLGERDRSDFHDAPQRVEHCRNGHAEKEQEKWIVEHALHEGDSLRRVRCARY